MSLSESFQVLHTVCVHMCRSQFRFPWHLLRITMHFVEEKSLGGLMLASPFLEVALPQCVVATSDACDCTVPGTDGVCFVCGACSSCCRWSQHRKSRSLFWQCTYFLVVLIAEIFRNSIFCFRYNLLATVALVMIWSPLGCRTFDIILFSTFTTALCPL